MKRFFTLFLIAVVCFPLMAQKPTDTLTSDSAIVYPTTQKYLAQLDSLRSQFDKWEYTGADTLGNPYYFYLFSSPTFYAAPVRRSIGQLSYSDSLSSAGYNTVFPSYLSRRALDEQIDRELLYVYTTSPWLIRNDEHQGEGADGIRTDLPTEVKPKVRLTDRFASAVETTPGEPGGDGLEIEVRKPNFWKFSADFALQFLQNYVTDNWYNGGESNYSLKADMTIRANYDNKQKFKFLNTLEMRLGFQKSQNDNIHKFRTNSDLIRLTNKLNITAVKRWDYTVMLQSWTQFYPGYHANDTKVYSDFMSPFESVLSVGMTYTLDVKNFHFDATLSPIAGNFKYVDRLSLSTSFGLKEGKHCRLDYGSNITANYRWNMFKNVEWRGRIYYFTDYSRTQVEWENTFNLKINKYLTTRLFLYPRFDDSGKRSKNGSYFQFLEELSVGFNITF